MALGNCSKEAREEPGVLVENKVEHQNITAGHINQPLRLVALVLCCVWGDARVWVIQINPTRVSRLRRACELFLYILNSACTVCGWGRGAAVVDVWMVSHMLLSTDTRDYAVLALIYPSKSGRIQKSKACLAPGVFQKGLPTHLCASRVTDVALEALRGWKDLPRALRLHGSGWMLASQDVALD